MKIICVKNKRAQSWGFDLIIASVIFIIGFIFIFVYLINYSPSANKDLNELFSQAGALSGLVLSEGAGGIISEGVINQTKAEEFYNLDYSSTKLSYGVYDDYYIEIPGFKIGGNEVGYIGYKDESLAEKVAVIDRISVYDSTIVKIKFYVWRS